MKDTHHKPLRLGYPGEVLFVNLVGPLPESATGMKYILTLQDGFSRYAAASMVPCKDADIVENRLVEDWVCLFGVPTQIHIDQGTELKNLLWNQLCDRLQMRKTNTPAYNPQSNQVECFHRTLSQVLQLYMDQQDNQWEKLYA